MEFPAGTPLTDKIALKKSEVLSNLNVLSQEDRHPLESLLSKETRTQRRVSRVVMARMPEKPTEESLRSATKKVLEKQDEVLFINGAHVPVRETQILQPGERPTDDRPALIISPAEDAQGVIRDNLRLPDQIWCVVGSTRLSDGTYTLTTAGDHLASDGNLNMSIVSSIAKELDAAPLAPGQRITYYDLEKSVHAATIDPERHMKYKDIIWAVVQHLRNYQDETMTFTIPVQKEIHGIKRMIPGFVLCDKNDSREDLDSKIDTAIKTARNSKTTIEKWLEMTSQGPKTLQDIFLRMQRSAFGERSYRLMRGLHLFSVMEGDYPIASTTMLPYVDGTAVTMVRNKSRDVLSLSISGGSEFWKIGELRDLVSAGVQ